MRLTEYTLRVTHRADWDVFEAELTEFYALKATGATREEALAELERLYTERVAYLTAVGKPLPVPGETPEALFSSTQRVDAEAGLMRDFFKRVLNMDYDDVYLNDATTLEEFGDFDALRKAVQRAYGVDIGDERERELWRVVAVIRAASR
jgi:predicted RNase H-like HicB family nuclease